MHHKVTHVLSYTLFQSKNTPISKDHFQFYLSRVKILQYCSLCSFNLGLKQCKITHTNKHLINLFQTFCVYV